MTRRCNKECGRYVEGTVARHVYHALSGGDHRGYKEGEGVEEAGFEAREAKEVQE
jgi:hypothetical protein